VEEKKRLEEMAARMSAKKLQRMKKVSSALPPSSFLSPLPPVQAPPSRQSQRSETYLSLFRSRFIASRKVQEGQRLNRPGLSFSSFVCLVRLGRRFRFCFVLGSFIYISCPHLCYPTPSDSLTARLRAGKLKLARGSELETPSLDDRPLSFLSLCSRPRWM